MTDFIYGIILFFNIGNNNYSNIEKPQKIENNIIIHKKKLNQKEQILELKSANIKNNSFSKRNSIYANVKKDGIKSLYFTAYAIGNKNFYKNLMNITKNTNVNSVIIDVKTVSGYVSFKMDNSKFGKIKPTSDNRIKNISEILKELHEKNIYVIARIVVFKDNLLAKKRPDLTYKWTWNKKKNWHDYAGHKYLDAGSQEVWDYNSEIAGQAYDLGFDEINFDYVRFPSDGRISQMFSPFSEKEIKGNKKGKIQIINKFSKYITSKLRRRYENIKLSADVFGLVTNGDMLGIGQSLEGFLENFDYVSPMTYPSHYGRGFLGFRNPDNHPYEIIKDSLKNSFSKIEKYNSDKNHKKKLRKEQIRLWLQGFTCTRCKGAGRYNSKKFKGQTKAIKDMGLKSFFVWNSGSKYYKSRYK